MSSSCKINNSTQPICSGVGICCPKNNMIWNYNSYDLITWDIMYPAYGNYSLIDIYFYYKKDYQYFHIMNFTNINKGVGYYIVYIDNNWFLNTTLNKSEEKIWNYSMIIVGKNVNPDTEFKDKLSNFQTVDFNIIQNGTLNQNINNNMTIFKNNTSETNNNENFQNINSFQIWKIILIVICFILIVIIFSLLIYIKLKKRKSKNRYNKDFKITDSKILQKPDEIVYQKLNTK